MPTDLCIFWKKFPATTTFNTHLANTSRPLVKCMKSLETMSIGFCIKSMALLPIHQTHQQMQISHLSVSYLRLKLCSTVKCGSQNVSFVLYRCGLPKCTAWRNIFVLEDKFYSLSDECAEWAEDYSIAFLDEYIGLFQCVDGERLNVWSEIKSTATEPTIFPTIWIRIIGHKNCVNYLYQKIKATPRTCPH